MNPTNLKELLSAGAIINFVHAAGDYCSFLENYPGGNGKEFLKVTLNHLLLLYNYGRNLLSVQPTDNEPINMHTNEAEMQKIRSLIETSVPFQFYWTIINSIDTLHQPETGCGDLIEDLHSIYMHLKQPLLLWNKKNDNAKEQALWLFKNNFDQHWGDHCINTLFAIHCYLHKER